MHLPKADFVQHIHASTSIAWLMNVLASPPQNRLLVQC